MKDTSLIITSIANQEHPVLNTFAQETTKRGIPFIVMGDTKSPESFELEGCDFYSINRQQQLPFLLADKLPTKHYARKNLGYLVAMSNGAKVIIETDDDNYPLEDFWNKRSRLTKAHLLSDKDWVNIYTYFTQEHIWPRGFALEAILNKHPELGEQLEIDCPIQQGLADINPDVDAIYRLTLPLPLSFSNNDSVALGKNTICPFNSQNTTWFEEAYPLMYLPSYCSFRMTDIWRSFIAQRIAWTCGWPILFHSKTVWQERNDHNLLVDFKDEISGYVNNKHIMDELIQLDLLEGVNGIAENMKRCYTKMIEIGLVGSEEMDLLNAWLSDVSSI